MENIRKKQKYNLDYKSIAQEKFKLRENKEWETEEFTAAVGEKSDCIPSPLLFTIFITKTGKTEVEKNEFRILENPRE